MAVKRQKRLSQEEMEARLERVAELRSMGWTQAQIAVDIGVTGQMAGQYLFKLQERHQSQQQFEVEQAVRRANKVLRESWKAWESEKTRQISEVKTGGKFAGTTERTITDPPASGSEHLANILNANKQIMDVLGLKPAKKVELTCPNLPYHLLAEMLEQKPLTAEDRMRLLLEARGVKYDQDGNPLPVIIEGTCEQVAPVLTPEQEQQLEQENQRLREQMEEQQLHDTSREEAP